MWVTLLLFLELVLQQKPHREHIVEVYYGTLYGAKDFVPCREIVHISEVR